MSAELPDHVSGAAHALEKPNVRSLTGLRQRARRAFHPAAGDRADRVVRAARRAAAPHRRGRRAGGRDPSARAASPTGWSTNCCGSSSTATDSEAFPTALCLTGFTAAPRLPCGAGDAAPARRDAVPGGGGDGQRRRRRSRGAARTSPCATPGCGTWRRLTGLAIGVEILPGELRAVLVGADGEVIEREHRRQPVMSPEAVAAGIAALADDMCRRQQPGVIAGAEVHLGVQIGGVVDAATGVVRHFHKRDPAGGAGQSVERRPSG